MLRTAGTSSSRFIATQRRNVGTLGGKFTGNERMILDKIASTNGMLNGGYLFMALGCLNLVGYGASLIMSKPDFKTQFSHKGEGKYFAPLRSWCASDRLTNIVWTAPALLLGEAKRMEAMQGYATKGQSRQNSAKRSYDK